RGVRRLDRPRDQVGAGGLRDRRSAAGAGRPHARALRVVGLLERDAAAGLAVRSGRGCAGVLPGARRVRDHTDGGGEHPGPDANPAAGDLRPRAGRADGRGERARADRRRRRRGAALRPEPAGAASLLAVVSVEIVKRYPGFTLDVSWRAEKSVVGLFGPAGAGKTLTLQCLAGLIRPDAGRSAADDRVFYDAALDVPLRRTLRDELRETLRGFETAAVVVTHDFTEAYRLADRIVVYESGRVIQSAPRAELLWQPASEAVARIMGLANVLRGTVVKATPERIQIGWRGQTLEAVNSPTRSYLPPPDSPIAFFIRPEYVRLIRK